MRVKSFPSGTIIVSAMLVLIFKSSSCITGCSKGIELCIKSVIPALFPFLVLSPLLTSSMSFKLPCWLHKALKIPDGGDSLWITGCLGGYPVGAQCIAQAAEREQISKRDAGRLLTFCCNCGPGFVFGICSSFFSEKWIAWALWLCHITGSAVIGILLPGNRDSANLSPAPKQSFIAAFKKALYAMAQICGWVILFRCLIEFIMDFGLETESVSIRVILIGMLELTNGCLVLPLISNEGLRFLVCEALLCFGGLCVAMQTASVARDIPLSYYFLGKIAQSIISTFFVAAVWSAIHCKWYTLLSIATLLPIILILANTILKNYSGNFCPIGV